MAEDIDVVSIEVDRNRRAPGSVHVVGPEQLDRFSYDDPHATLQMVPGVYIRQEDGFGLRPNIGIRGALSDRSKKVTLMEDGVLFGPAPYSAPAAYYFPIISRMRRMAVTKGPSAVRYGPQTVGGAIDLHTRKVPQQLTAGLDLSAGQFGYAKGYGHVGVRGAHNGALLEGIHLRSSGFKELEEDADTGFRRDEWMLKLHQELGTGGVHQLEAKFGYSSEQSNETYLGLTDSDFRDNPLRRYEASQLDRMTWRRYSSVLSYDWEASTSLRLHVDAYWHDLSRSWHKVNHFAGAALFGVLSEPDSPRNELFYELLNGDSSGNAEQEALLIGPNDRDYVSRGVQARLQYEVLTGAVHHTIEWGVRLHNDGIERNHTEDLFVLTDGQPAAVPDAETLLTTFNEANSTALSLHAVDELFWSDLTLTPGVRLEWLQSTAENFLAVEDAAGRIDQSLAVWLFGVGAHYNLGHGVGVLVGVHRGMSPPPPGAGDATQPELSVNYEAGMRYLQGYRKLEWIGYFNDYRNLTNICTLSGGCDQSSLDLQFDAGRARIYGFEASAEEQLLFESFRVPLTASYTLTQTEFLETFQSRDPLFGQVEAGDELPYVPQHQMRASVGVELERAGGYAAFTYTSPMRERSGAAPLSLALTTDRTTSLDVGGHFWAMDGARLYIRARNLLGTASIVSRRPYGARPNAPRWVQAGVELQY